MKTLKKTLCMVLAVVMVVGVLILPASADDAADKAKAQKAAYETLEDYGIMHGRDGGAAALDEYVRRDEVATIVYRILTGDTSEDGKMAGNYKAAAKNFTDVATTNWAAGFIGYTAESKIFSGRAGNAFDPTANVRGDELVKVMLRCLGYGAEDEYTGEGWNTRALYTAQEIGMLKGIDEQMDQPITRGAVAQIVANAIKLPMAVYYNGTYSSYRDVSGRPVAPNTPGATPNPALVAYNDNKGDVKYDDWGAPYYEYTPTISFNHVYGAEAKKLDKVTEKLAPKGEYFVATTECDICEDGGIEKTASLVEYINGTKQAANHDIQATDNVGTVGAQGQWTRTFDVDGKDGIDLVVRVDTLLAQVVEVTKEEKDPAGHIKVAATMGLSVYVDTDNDPTDDDVNYVVAGNDYKKGDFILLRAVATNATTLSVDKDSKLGTYYEIIGAAPQFPGAQTTIWYNTASHVIDGKTYPDNNRLHLDKAKTTGGNYVWFTDGNGNIIGSVDAEAAPASYAILKNMIWKTGNPGHAEATLLYMDGTEATVTVASIDGDNKSSASTAFASWTTTDATPTATDGSNTTVKFNGTTKGTAYVSDEGSLNTMYNGYALYAVTVKSNGSVNLKSEKVTYITDGTLKAKDFVIKADTIYASDNTVIVYKDVDGSKVTYTRVVGKDNIIARTAAKLFYVDANGDKVAEYVYVVDGTETSATRSHLVAALTDKYSKGLYDGDAIYTLDKAFVGGKEVPAGTIYSATETYITALTDNVGSLYWVKETTDAITTDPSTTKVTTAGNTIAAGTAPSAYSEEAVYLLDKAVKVSVSGGILSIDKIGSSTATKSNVVMAVSDLKTVYGADKAALADVEWSKVNAYVVVKDSVVTDLYILPIPEPAENPSGGTPSTIKLEGGFTVELTTDGVTAKFKVHADSDTAAKAAKWKAVTKIEQLFATGYTEVTTNTTTIDMSSKTDYSSDGVSVYDGTLFDGSNYRVTCSLYADDKLVGTATATGIPTTP